jgi:hypothetical protein
MSGGTRSRPARPEGDHPACTTERRKDGDTGRARPKGRLGLDGWGDAGPLFDLREESQPLGWPMPFTRKGSKPDGRDDRLGSREPGHGVVRTILNLLLFK